MAISSTISGLRTNWSAPLDTVGWRGTFVWLPIGWGGLTLILCLFFLDAQDRSLTDAAQGRRTDKTPMPVLSGLSPRKAAMDFALWRVGVSNFIVMTLTMGLTINLFPILTEAGVSRASAAWLTSLAGIAGTIGKLVTGALLDRFRPNWIGGLTLATASLAFLLLLEGVKEPRLIVVALLINGYAAGTKTQITGFLTASYGGMKHIGVIYGVVAALMALASGIGPSWLA